jgi:hypothetical protein
LGESKGGDAVLELGGRRRDANVAIEERSAQRRSVAGDLENERHIHLVRRDDGVPAADQRGGAMLGAETDSRRQQQRRYPTHPNDELPAH